MNSHRGDYGYDAPPALIGLAGIAILQTILAVASWMTPGHPRFVLAAGRAVICGLLAAWFYYWTRRRKFRVWEHILDGLRLQGSEQVLDMGCGRGAVLTAVARRLTTGKVTGVDLWRWMDQSGNSANATMANARAEGMAGRVAVETGDMRRLDRIRDGVVCRCLDPVPRRVTDPARSGASLASCRSRKEHRAVVISSSSPCRHSPA